MEPRRLVEHKLREWLRDHHCVISHSEGLNLGATPAQIKSMVDRGEWTEIYPHIYRETASPPEPYQDLRAAWLATAGYAVVSHLSAAWVWGMTHEPPAIPELTVLRGARDLRGWTGFTIHQSRDLDVAAAVLWKGVPVTNPLRTLVDVAGSVSPARLTEAVDHALAKKLVTPAGLEAEIGRLSSQGRAGTGVLRRHLAERAFIGAPTPSVLEAHAQRLIAGTGIPLPTPEVCAGKDGQYRLDFAWKAILFAVEVDGYAWHSSPEHKRRDETRRARLRAAGWTLLVFDWHQVLNQSGWVAQEITETYHRLSQP